MKNVKVQWYKNFIKSVFEKIPFENGGIEVNLFWDKAKKSGLWARGMYGAPVSEALSEMAEKLQERENEQLSKINII